MARGRSKRNKNKAGNQGIPANTHSSANPPSKRRRLEDDESLSDSDEETYITHPQHWYRDGNLFLQIGTVRFRLYAGRLAAESNFFKVLFNQRQGKHSSSMGYEYQSQIDQVLATAKRVGPDDGSDLFYLDPEEELLDAPSEDEFAELLTAMNSGVDFVFNRPTLQQVCSIWYAAVFYEMSVYETFCERYVEESFPDTWLTISANPCELQAAVSAVRLGADYPILKCFRPAFYDLARTPLLDFATRNGAKDATQIELQLAQVIDRRTALTKLGAVHMATLLDLQKRLGLAWVDIFKLLDVSCTEHSTCTQFSTVMALVSPIWEDLPYDPIMGIRRILEDKSISSAFCNDIIGQVKDNLTKEADALWVTIGEWINMSLEESDSGDDSI